MVGKRPSDMLQDLIEKVAFIDVRGYISRTRS